ncbi:urea transporter [Corynebacterium uberis]|uniref:urea transporter n=1 Tax=Corynebacterium TaxID=1716 RepID=UPI001D0B9EC3|nr:MULTISPECIES: urea transporter [Corynebacterium]MCZ9309504.1 urea transporter [Corynebacterium sp. c6VSa_13]UDL73052.1 urea transporter [Corynebacterium uberis]UDL78283.1 urea transporter [Corynebacterium uberis]UDL80566.1 urea transporter [Corynebacterium uberis]UDL82701.1 urea transporter [Corynebacterium uberis]
MLTALARGLAQIYLASSPLTGVLILAGLAIAAPDMAVLVAIGAAIQPLAARAMRVPDAQVRAGLFGYNGALCGTTTWACLGLSWTGVAVTAIGAMLCVPIHLLVARLATRGNKRWDLPVLTVPFCALSTALVAVVPTRADLPAPSHGPVIAGAANAMAEVCRADGWLPGLIILAGLALAGWRIATWALAGWAASCLAVVLPGVDTDALATGVPSYCSVLVAIAVGAVFLPQASLPVRAGATAAGVVVALLVQAGLVALGIGVFTWPFIAGTWAGLLLGRALEGLPRG